MDNEKIDEIEEKGYRLGMFVRRKIKLRHKIVFLAQQFEELIKTKNNNEFIAEFKKIMEFLEYPPQLNDELKNNEKFSKFANFFVKGIKGI